MSTHRKAGERVMTPRSGGGTSCDIPMHADSASSTSGGRVNIAGASFQNLLVNDCVKVLPTESLAGDVSENQNGESRPSCSESAGSPARVGSAARSSQTDPIEMSDSPSGAISVFR